MPVLLAVAERGQVPHHLHAGRFERHEVGRVGFSANNVTYALLGEAFVVEMTLSRPG